MRVGEGVEWVLHSCVLLAWLGGGPASTKTLAAAYELPPAYLNKQLQALVRAGLLTSTSGPRGGFSLARRPEAITLLEVGMALEGDEDPFRCQEIRRRGIGAGAPARDFRSRCTIAAAMRRADTAWRRELAGQTLADVVAAADRSAPAARERAQRWHHDRAAAR